VFVDPTVLAAWVPGLRRARVIATNPDGLPLEIQFEFSTSLIYSLVYTYDAAAREVRWEPRAGKRDAVRGFARFDPFDEGTRITYSVEHGGGRSTAEQDAPHALLDAFAKWMADER
jgi:hypothetical protein